MESQRSANLTATGTTDTIGALSTEFRRFQSIAFDQFGYFSQSIALTSATSTTTGGINFQNVHRAERQPRLRRELVRQRSCVGFVRNGDAGGAVARRLRSSCPFKARGSSA